MLRFASPARVRSGALAACLLAAAFHLAPLLHSPQAWAQSGDPKSGEQTRQQAPANVTDVAKDNQRKVDEFSEAAQAINGPAGNPECVWLGRRVVGLMWRDDLDTAFRHLDLYDRFGCPGGPQPLGDRRLEVRIARHSRIDLPFDAHDGAAHLAKVRHADERPLGRRAHVDELRFGIALQKLPRLARADVAGICRHR